MTLTQTLMSTLANTASSSIQGTSQLMSHAKKNKVLLQYLRTTGHHDETRQTQEAGLRKISEALLELAGQIQHLDYAFIKFFKPVAYLPSDIDLLLKRNQLPAVSSILYRLGYQQTVSEPNCVTFTGKVVIDVYINPDVLNIPYLCGRDLLKYVTVTEIGGVKIKKLQNAAEVVLVASHAIYKEQIVTLNDYYSVKSFLSRKSFQIAKKCSVYGALVYVLEVFSSAETGKVNLPLKIPLNHTSKLFLSKIIEDPFSRRAIPWVCLKLFDRRVPRLMFCRIRRQTY